MTLSADKTKRFLNDRRQIFAGRLYWETKSAINCLTSRLDSALLTLCTHLVINVYLTIILMAIISLGGEGQLTERQVREHTKAGWYPVPPVQIPSCRFLVSRTYARRTNDGKITTDSRADTLTMYFRQHKMRAYVLIPLLAKFIVTLRHT